MRIALNPTPSKISEIIGRSKFNAAKWLKNLETGDLYFWAAEESFHKDVANLMHVSKYDKGIAVL